LRNWEQFQICSVFFNTPCIGSLLNAWNIQHTSVCLERWSLLPSSRVRIYLLGIYLSFIFPTGRDDNCRCFYSRRVRLLYRVSKETSEQCKWVSAASLVFFFERNWIQMHLAHSNLFRFFQRTHTRSSFKHISLKMSWNMSTHDWPR
jgi:hypothetical protein